MNKEMYTMDSVPFNKFHLKVISYTTGGSFVDGYILGIIEFALISVAAYMNMNATWQGLIASSPLIGVLIGSVVFGNLSDKIGRSKIYSIDFVIILVASILQFFVNVPFTLYVLRLILGLCIGAEYAVGPTLVAEFVPSKLRGKILTIVCIAWTVGYVLASYAGAWLSTLGDESWRWMLASSAVIALIVLILRIGMPESPRWLIHQGRIDEAKAIVAKHFGDTVTLDPTIEEIKSSRTAHLGYMHLFSKKQIKHTIFAAICWGANTLPLFAILSFVPMILDALGIQDENTFYTLILNGIMLLACIFVLFVVDAVSRRKLLIVGMVMASVPLLVLGIWGNAPVWIIIICFALHLLGNQAFGTIAAYIYPVECFPTELRTSGAGFCSAISRLFAIVGTFILPTIIAEMGVGIALIGIAIVIIIGLVLAIIWAPETNGMSIDDM